MRRSEVSTSVVKWSEHFWSRVSIIIRRYEDIRYDTYEDMKTT